MRTAFISIACALATLINASVSAEVTTKVVEYSYAGTSMKGFLAWDDASEEKRPGILVVHEWWGLNDYAKKRAVELAGQGYVAFAADMYGEGRVASHPDDATAMMSAVKKDKATWVGRAQAALDTLKADQHVNKEKVAAVGYCFGGATVLELAYSGAELSGVATLHGALSVPTPAQAKMVKAKILICHGGRDSFVPEETATALRHILDENGVDYQMVYYGGAYHSFTVPSAPGKGGLAYSPGADKRSMQHLRDFFAEIF